MSTPTSQLPAETETVASSFVERSGPLMAWMDAALAQSRRIREESLAVRERSRSLLQANRSLTNDLSNFTRAVKGISDVINGAATSAIIAPPAVRAAETGPLPSARRPRPNKLVHKNRWLISVDVVAALARAGVDCNIIVPGMDPVREGYDPTLPRH